LPLNFNSPYKATSIIDFWRRWHITLSRFLRDYLYIPLGGSRKGKLRRYINLMTTMVLGGLWHGAGWTFVAWGGLHGFYLIINHGWRAIFQNKTKTKFGSFFAWMVTFLAVVVSWVPFRAESISGAKSVLSGMVGVNGFVLPESILNKLNRLAGFGDYLLSVGVEFSSTPFLQSSLSILLLLFVSTLMPNTQWLSLRYSKSKSKSKYEIFIGLVLFYAVLSMQSNISEFLYYEF
jgi:alginate O-acetyltransferase complex protein AlgI